MSKLLECEDCFSIFREEDATEIVENEYVDNGIGREKAAETRYLVCPICGSDNINEYTERRNEEYDI